MEAGNWTWLEVAKISAGILTPVTIAVLGVALHRITKRFEQSQWRGQKLVEKRLAVYDDLAPLLNDVMCYFTFVGCWKDLSPPEVVALKRVIDKKVYVAAPLFSRAFFETCMKFQSLCFETYSGWGQDARLKTKFGRRRDSRTDWDAGWKAAFSDTPSNPEDVRAAYSDIMRVFAQDIGVTEDPHLPGTGKVPWNIR